MVSICTACGHCCLGKCSEVLPWCSRNYPLSLDCNLSLRLGQHKIPKLPTEWISWEGLVMSEDSKGFTLTDCRICSLWILLLVIVRLTSPDLHSIQTGNKPHYWDTFNPTLHVPSEHVVLKVTVSKPLSHRDDLLRLLWDQPQAIHSMWYTTLLRDLYALMLNFLNVNSASLSLFITPIYPYAVLFWGGHFSSGLSPWGPPPIF